MVRLWASTAIRPSPPKTRAIRSANSGDPLLPPGLLPVLVVGGVADGAEVAPSTAWVGGADGAEVAPSTAWVGVADGAEVAPSTAWVGVADGAEVAPSTAWVGVADGAEV